MPIYQQRRTQLAQRLLPSSLVLLPAAREVLRNGDTHYLFRQDSDFYYLTGFTEPDAMAVLSINAAREVEYSLFVRPNDAKMEIWNGKRAGVEGACTEWGADTAYAIEEFAAKLPTFLHDKTQIYYPFGKYNWFDEFLHGEIAKWRLSRLPVPVQLLDVSVPLSELRLYKTAEEIAALQRAADISAAAHIHGMQICRPDLFEYELAAEYMYYFLKEGGMGAAYPSIVAAGANACTLHYTANRALLHDGDLVLIDAGAEYAYYGADITRTFPINGRFTAEQRAIYEVVLTAQTAVIQALKPGVPFVTAQNTCTRVLTEGLVSLGILHGDLDNLLEQKAYLPFYMHGCSHWLGLDTHDVGAYKMQGASRLLAPNMVLTVEPGLYIRPETGADERWHNIGIRIEDDILITPEGCRVMTAKVPKTVDEIERLMQ